MAVYVWANIHHIWWCYISDFYKSNRTRKITSNRDIQTDSFATCAANTSEQCSFSWLGTYRDSSDHLEVSGPTIDLKSRGVELSSMRCRAVCTIRNKVCVSEPMFIEFPSVSGEFLVSLADKILVKTRYQFRFYLLFIFICSFSKQNEVSH